MTDALEKSPQFAVCRIWILGRSPWQERTSSLQGQPPEPSFWTRGDDSTFFVGPQGRVGSGR